MFRVTGSNSGMILWWVIRAVRLECTFRKP